MYTREPHNKRRVISWTSPPGAEQYSRSTRCICHSFILSPIECTGGSNKSRTGTTWKSTQLCPSCHLYLYKSYKLVVPRATSKIA